MKHVGGSITLVRTIKAPPRTVFAAWIDPGKLKRLFGLSRVEVDPRVGGRYRFENSSPEPPGLHVVSGEYKKLEPGRRIVKSWIYERPMSPDAGVETLVTIELFEIEPNVVELFLREEGPTLADCGERELAREKWFQTLNDLEALHRRNEQ